MKAPLRQLHGAPEAQRPGLLILAGSVDPAGKRGMGGAEWIAAQLARHAVRHFRVHLLVLEEPAAGIAEQFGRAGVTLHVASKAGRVDPQLWAAVRRIVIREKIAAAFGSLQGLNIHLLIPALLLPRLAVVTSIHHAGLSDGVLVLAEGLLTRRASRLILPSRAAYDAVRRQFRLPEKRCALIRNGADLQRFSFVQQAERFAARRELGLPADCTLLYSPARIARDKGQDILAAAFVLLDPAGLSRPLLWVNTGARQNEALARQVEALAEEHRLDIRLLPPTSLVERYMAACDAVVLPSRTEAGPNAAVEAWACGRPLVGSRVGYLLEHAGQAGLYLADPGDSAGLAQQLRVFLAEPDAALDAAGASLRQLAEEQYSQERNLEQYCQVLLAAIKRP